MLSGLPQVRMSFRIFSYLFDIFAAGYLQIKNSNLLTQPSELLPLRQFNLPAFKRVVCVTVKFPGD
jgi:hypothetical protein